MINEASANIAKFMHMYEEIKEILMGKAFIYYYVYWDDSAPCIFKARLVEKLSKAYQESYKTSTEENNCQ